MSCLYRIYTEDLNRPEVERDIQDVVANFSHGGLTFDNFTLIKGIGYYNGSPEECVIIEIIAEIVSTHYHEAIVALCKEIKESNNQECVLLTRSRINATFIG